MLPRKLTLSELSEERRRQDQDFLALSAGLSGLDPALRFRLNAERFAELEAAWKPRAACSKASNAEYPSLRA